jgi:predicted RNase H-like HicB family nuclease
MTAKVALTAIYETVEGGWVQARVKELPAVITAAPTLDEAKELLLDAVREYLLSLVSTREVPEGPGERIPLEIVITAA